MFRRNGTILHKILRLQGLDGGANVKISRTKNGLAGKILRIDLSAGKITTEDTMTYAQRFIGGRAINSFILFRLT